MTMLILTIYLGLVIGECYIGQGLALKNNKHNNIMSMRMATIFEGLRIGKFDDFTIFDKIKELRCHIKKNRPLKLVSYSQYSI